MRFRDCELDPFQEEAVRAIDDGRSVIVAAPTGAGKTLVAEYAIEKHIAAGHRIIYTAPIKALSNQKFRDFSRSHPGKIGIMTGDVIINPEAPVLIMTTEIFRNIIFDSDGERLRDVRYVIFDEIHYIDDVERGTVWEECIIFAPPHISFICLSATIPNIADFADWISSVRNQPVVKVTETRRPVPLKTFIFVPRHGIRKLESLRELKEPRRPGARGKPRVDSSELIRRLRDNDQFPSLYFMFSRAGCRENALKYAELRLLNRQERDAALSTFDDLCRQFDILKSPGVESMRRLVGAGVAYHHAGLLPALKEVLERLYTLGLIKLLFTTETFAVGINMPARSVVFDSLLKFDGVSLRPMTSREFNQMAGRAGRRGIDSVGFAYPIVVPGDFQYENVAHTISNDVERIESQFRLSYSSILNLYAAHGAKIYEVCEKSFSNYTAATQVHSIRARIRGTEDALKELLDTPCHHGDFKRIMEYLETKKKLQPLRHHPAARGGGGWRARELERLTAQLEASECHRCRRKNACRKAAREIIRLERERRDLEKLVRDTMNFQKNALTRKLDFLRRMGYVADAGLLPRGETAAQIYGYEIQFTELYFDGFFEDLSAEEINVVANAVVNESRRTASFRRIADKRIRRHLALAARAVAAVRKSEQEAGILDPVKPLDFVMTGAILEWSRGCDFETLKGFVTEDDGDIVRSFRLTVDFLRQMRRAVPDQGFQEKLSKSISLIYRGVVDAEAQLNTQI
ncbi:MAG: DEAD/DEAH box helicase [bacterium]